MQNSIADCKSASQELAIRSSRIRPSEVLAETGKLIGDFDNFLSLLKEYLEEDALEYIRGALDGDAEDLAQLKKIAKIFEEGKGKIGRKLSKAEAEAGMEAFWGEGGEAGARAAIGR